jgi:hypothetical protein
METDHQHEDGGSKPRKEAGEDGRDKRLMLGHNSSSEAQAGGSSGQAGLVSQGVNKLLPTFHVHLPVEEGAGIAPAFGVPAVQESHSVEAMQNMHSGPMDVDECKLKGLHPDALEVAVTGDQIGSALAHTGEGIDEVQEGLSQAEDCTEGISDAGSLNSEEEQELEDYFKEIEEENRVEEENKGQSEQRSTAALPAIPEASPRMTGTRRSKRRASESDVEVALKAEKIKALKNKVTLFLCQTKYLMIMFLLFRILNIWAYRLVKMRLALPRH